MPTIRLRLATADQIRGWSCGEVTRPDLLDGATGRPVPGGLACEAIFGPTEDHTCRCGRRHTPPPGVAVSCPDCGVPILPRSARRDRFGHIELAAPVPHPWYLRRGSPVLALLLGQPATTVRGILAGSVAVVAALDRATVTRLIARERAALDEELAAIGLEFAGLARTAGNDIDADAPGAPGALRREAEALAMAGAARRELLERLRPGSLLAHEEARALCAALGAGLEIATGGAGLACLLDRLDLTRLETHLRKALAMIGEARGDDAAGETCDLSPDRAARLRRRLRAVALLRRGGTTPGALLLRALPVLPPDLRPVIDAGAHLIASDLNALYAGVLAQNARLRRLRAAGAPAIVLAHAERGLQRAVAALLDNACQPRPTTPRSPGRVSGGGRPLIDLSARLGGKAGRFRGHLLGKRVDYSGRAVIVPGPALALDECGLPWDLALELFAPFVAHELLAARAVATPRAARRAIARREAAVWPALERAAAGRLVLLNRAPTLHRLSLRAFRPVLVAGGAIRLHPLVTKGFNADFDGDQMAVHLPLSAAAQAEARTLMLPSRGLRAPAHGGTTLVPQQEIVLGLHYLTLAGAGPGAGDGAIAPGDGHRYWRPEDALAALDHGATTIGARCRVLLPADWGGDGRTWVPTTPGRLLFNAALPPALRFQGGAQGDGSLRALLAACQEKLGDAATVALAERLTELGYRWATRGGLSIGVGDAPVPPERVGIIAAARREEAAARADEARGLLAREELHAALAAIWDGARRSLAAAIRRDLAPQNPLAMAIDSGARGKLAQVTQLAGLRGLVQDLRGRAIPFPIAASYREGLTALEYVVACRGARKGFADRSLNTAPAGYLTRRLVLAAQDAIAGEEDCGTVAGLPVTLPGPGASEEATAAARAALLGRVLATDVAGIARAGEPLAAATVERRLAGAPGGAAIVRSPLTCTARRGVCRRCYGADPATGALVAAGAAVGVVAAQAVGEPGTQLTMTTFHLGGVALGGDITSGLPRVEELLEARRPRGCAPLAPLAGRVTLRGEGGSTFVAIRDPETGQCREVALPPGRAALVAEGQAVEAGEPLAAGPLDPRELARLRGTLAAQRYLIASIQAVYRREGVAIDDRHLEVIARQLARLVRVTAPGDSGLLPGELLDSGSFLDAARATLAQGGDPPLAAPELVGLAEAARQQPSFLAAAAFERATLVLAEAALAGREDDLSATNARVLLGAVVPRAHPARSSASPSTARNVPRESGRSIAIRPGPAGRSRVGTPSACIAPSRGRRYSVRTIGGGICRLGRVRQNKVGDMVSDTARAAIGSGIGELPRPLPEYQPAAWVTVALPFVDLDEGVRQLGELLSDRRRWAIAAPQRESREAIAQIAEAIRALVPLHRLTAALIAPWLLEVSAAWADLGPGVPPGQAAPAAVVGRLEAVIAERYATPTPGDYHPWIGLAEWIWSQQTAWAVTAMQQELGREAVLTLSPADYQARVGEFMGHHRDPDLVRERASFLLLSFAQEFSKVIVHALDLAVLPIAQVRQLLALEPLRPGGDLLRRNAALPLTVLQRAPLVRDDHLTVLGDDLSYAVRQALSLRDFRDAPGTPWPTASLSVGAVTGAAQLRPPIPESLGDLSADQFDLWVEAMWRQRDELSDLDADMLDWLCAVYILQTRAGSTRAYADLHDFLKLRGHLQRHRGQGVRTGYETEARQQALRSLGHLQNLTITVTEAGDADDAGDAPLGLASQAITISDRVGPIGPQGQVELSRFEFRPGAVFTAFLLGPGGQTALLSAMALRYDPYRQDWEKRLARLFSWSWRRAALDGTGHLRYPVWRLLEAAGKEMYARKPSRTRERLEVALDLLQQDGVIGAWHYLDWEEPTAARQGWATLWQACEVRIVPPLVVLQPDAAAATAALADGIPLGDDDIGAVIKVERKLRGNISQSRAAKELNCSPGYINKLEGDKPNKPRPSEEFRRRVHAWAVMVRDAQQGRATP